jgi:hypothetical protein
VGVAPSGEGLQRRPDTLSADSAPSDPYLVDNTQHQHMDTLRRVCVHL